MLTKILKSVLRIVIAVVCILFVLVLGFGVVVRQPFPSSRELHPNPKADANRLRAHVDFLCDGVASRHYKDVKSNQEIQTYLIEHFSQSTSRVELQKYTAGGVPQANVIARFGPENSNPLIVGAHYDTFDYLPGADDNASAVAGLLELARLLAVNKPKSSVTLVAYGTEEPPCFASDQMGSAVHAASLDKNRAYTMIALEMIGYFSPKQPVHDYLLSAVYPRHGNWACIVGRWQDRKLARSIKRSFRTGTDLPVYSFSGPTAYGGDLSDHRNYWANGFNAVMVTDTAFLRNPNYHTDNDTPDTLDYDRMAKVVDGVFQAVSAW